MQKVRLAAITAAAMLAVGVALLAAWWVSGRSRSTPAHASPVPAGATEVTIDIPSAAGPSSAALVDNVAPLDPGKPAQDAGQPPSAEPAR